MGRDHFPNIPIGAGMGFARGVMLLDDCEGTNTWIAGGTGGDDVHLFATAAAFQGTYGLRLKTRTTDAAAADSLSVRKILSYPESGLFVHRFRFCTPDVTKIADLMLVPYIYDGTDIWSPVIWYTFATGVVEYQNSAGAAVALTALAHTIPNLCWSIIELVLDLKAKQYVSLMINGLRADLSGLGLQDTGDDAARDISLGIAISAVGADPAEMYLDNIYAGEYLES